MIQFITNKLHVRFCSMKISIIGPGLGMGGVERASSVFANSLDKYGFQITYIAIFKKELFFLI